MIEEERKTFSMIVLREGKLALSNTEQFMVLEGA